MRAAGTATICQDEVSPEDAAGRLTIAGLQSLSAQMYSQKDAACGIDEACMWQMEDVGELAAAMRHVSRLNQS
jgi:hypothetical protein